MPDESLADALADLAHDLGKAVRRPLAWLPADASDADVRQAAEEALLATRRKGSERISAQALWDAFLAEVEPPQVGTGGPAVGPAWAAMVAAVERALAWAARLDPPEPLDRAALEADLAAVTPAIRALIEEVERG